MTEPQFEFPRPEPKQTGPTPIWGWLMLGTLVALLAGLQLQQYLSPSKPDPDAEYATLDRQVGLSVRMREFMTAMQQVSAPRQEPTAREREQLDSALKPIVSQLAMERAEKSAALNMYAVLRHELGHALSPEDLKRLTDSKDEHARALGAIYAPGKLTAPEAKKAIADLKGDRFVWRLARVHAEEEAKLPSGRQALMDPTRTLLFFAVAGVLLLVGVVGLGLWMVYFAMRSSGRLAPVGFEHFEISPTEANANAGRAAAMLCGLFGGMLLIGGLTDAIPGFPDAAAAPLSFLVAILLAFAILGAKFDGTSMTPRRIGWFGRDFGKNVAWGLGAFAMEIPLTLTLMLAGQAIFSFLPPPSHPVTIEISNNPSPLTIILLFLTAAIGAPLLEEIVFRGTLFPAMAARMRSLFGAMVLNGFMFAIIHPTGIPAWPALAGVGAMAAFVAYQRGSVVPAIVMHACHNALIMSLALTL